MLIRIRLAVVVCAGAVALAALFAGPLYGRDRGVAPDFPYVEKAVHDTGKIAFSWI